MKARFNYLIQWVLSTLLYYANRQTKEDKFYLVKGKLLERYGIKVGMSVQYIEGKECWTCKGTNVYNGYDHQTQAWYKETCLNCVDGYYIRPVWNIMDRIQFGKYIFLKPNKRVYEKPEIDAEYFTGYTRLVETRLGTVAIFILCLLYEKGYLKRFYKQSGEGWRVYGWPPRNLLHNTIHILKYRTTSYPVRRASEWLQIHAQRLIWSIKQKFSDPKQVAAQEAEDLPF